MGNNITKMILTHKFSCQICEELFDREFSGSLLCLKCRASSSYPECLIESNIGDGLLSQDTNS